MKGSDEHVQHIGSEIEVQLEREAHERGLSDPDRELFLRAASILRDRTKRIEELEGVVSTQRSVIEHLDREVQKHE